MREQLSGPRPIDGKPYELDYARETAASSGQGYYENHPNTEGPYTLDENQKYHHPIPTRYISKKSNAPASPKLLNNYVKLQIRGYRNGQPLQPQDTVVVPSLSDVNLSYTFQHEKYEWIPEMDATMIREKYICRIEHE